MNEELTAEAFPWLLRQRVTLPGRVAGYIHRPELLEKAMPTGRRLTVLKASGGFGKTVLLAECCRQLRATGLPAAYLLLDERDTPDMLDTYLAVACATAGLDVRHGADSVELMDQPAYRTALVASRIQSRGKPFVIALDEMEQLKAPICAAIVELLLRQGPPNLHFVLAGREMPDSLNIGALALDGHAKVLDADDLRFARAEVASFFNHRLTRRALAREAERSAGWPIALRISRNGIASGAERSSLPDHLASNWIESRLFARLARDERDLVLDLGLFGWFDQALLTEALRLSDAISHIQSLDVLDGLLYSVDSPNGPIWRLHPLIRRHCATRRRREDAERFRGLHRRIARTLARRGETVAAMRHATDGDDPSLAGEIFENAGGVRVWVLDGVAPFREAMALMTDEVVAKSPRLKLARCLALILSGHHHEARRLYAECSQLPAGPVGAEEWVPGERDFDECIVRSTMFLYGGEALNSAETLALFDHLAKFARSRNIDRPAQGGLEYSQSSQHFLRGEFEAALAHLRAVRTLLPESRYLQFYGELLRGQVRFVQGRVAQARSSFDSARRIVRKHLPLDPVALLSSEVTRRELLLECEPDAVAEPPGIQRALTQGGVPFSFFTTALSLFTQLRLLQGDAENLAAATGQMLTVVGKASRPVFAAMLAASHVSALVAAGEIDQAEALWQQQALPETTASCLDMKTRSWREIESVAEARARLLIETGRYDEARELLKAFGAFAEERSYRRMQLRALAYAVKLEHRAGDPEASLRHLGEYLRIFDETPYVLPLVRERAACEALVSQVADDTSSPHQENAALLLAAMRRLDQGGDLQLSGRERQVLETLPLGSVKAMATSLELSPHGVRYHLRRLFKKFGVSNRDELLRRAQERRLIT